MARLRSAITPSFTAYTKASVRLSVMGRAASGSAQGVSDHLVHPYGRETPFFLAHETEASIPIDVCMPALCKEGVE